MTLNSIKTVQKSLTKQVRTNWKKSIIRVSTRQDSCLWIFSLLENPDGWLSEQLCYQDFPKDEATEKTTINSLISTEYSKAFKVLLYWVNQESFINRDLTLPENLIFRAKNFK